MNEQEQFSTRDEPVFRDEWKEKAASEPQWNGVDGEDEVARDSVFNEPNINMSGSGVKMRQWIEAKRQNCTLAGDWGITILAGIGGGLFAIIGAFLSVRQGTWGILYIVLFGPLLEEVLKQSGAIYLVEKKAYRIGSAWQFIAIGLISGVIFASIENLIYTLVYFPPDRVANYAGFVFFRWTRCLGLHVIASLIASTGMIRVWRKMSRDGRFADLSDGYWPFFIAILLHCMFNAWALWFGPEFD